MTKAELIEKIYSNVDIEKLNKKQTADLVDAIFGALSDAIKTDKRFTYPGFGTFTVKDRAARDGRNPRTGEAITIAASRTVNFKPAPKFKEALGVPEEAAPEKKKKAPAKKKSTKKSTKKK